MTLLDTLHSHIGSLIHLKVRIYWYSSNSWDNVNERICLLLGTERDNTHDWSGGEAPPNSNNPVERAYALLLIDGSPKWILLSEGIMEFIE